LLTVHLSIEFAFVTPSIALDGCGYADPVTILDPRWLLLPSAVTLYACVKAMLVIT
jgi:hypothetical protein